MSCESHLEFFETSLLDRQDWALRLLKSWFEFASKPSLKNIINFGPFTDCINFQQTLNSSHIQGQHCLVSYSSILSHHFDDFDDTSIEYEIDSIIEKETFILTNGICVPASCSLSEIEIFLRNHFKQTDIIVLNTYCQIKDDLSLGFLDFIVLLIFTALLLISSMSTYLDYKYKGKLVNKILKSFSMRRNLSFLLKTEDNKSNIQCLNGLKAISAIWIIIGHKMDMLMESSNSIKEFMSLEEKLILRISEMFTSVVDTFLLISGVLVSIKCLKLFKERKFSIKNHIFKRFLRFVPALGIIIAFFMSSWPKFLAKGPQTFDFKEELKDCRKNWLKTLLLVGNFNGNFCLRHTWYTSTDFQLFIISPAIVYGLFKFKTKFLNFIAFIVVVGQINIFIHNYSSESDEFYHEFYYRFSPWFIGIMLGYKMGNSRGNQDLLTFGCIISILSLILMEFLRFNEKSRLSAALYEATHRIIWSSALAWIIYVSSCVKCCGFLMNFLSHRVWTFLSKMCLSIYLVHYLVVMLSFVSMEMPYQFDIFWLIKILLWDVLLSLIFSFAFYMLVEAPISRIVKTRVDYSLIENR